MNNLDYVLNQKDLKDMYVYCSNSGVFTLAKDTPRKKKGDKVGYLANGYLKTTIKGKHYHLSRLAWMYVYGVWPNNFIDHIDHDRKNNRIDNLRDVTALENNRNKGLKKDKAYGVSWDSVSNMWNVYINSSYDSSYECYPDAVNRRKELERENSYHKNHGKSDTYNHYDDIMSMYKELGMK